MGKSSLTQVTVPAATSNYTKGRSGYKICKLTPHHVAGVLTAEQIGRIFQTVGRKASSNYGIGNDGKIACYVDEDDRAWTSSSQSNDFQAITVEVSNSSGAPEWRISDAAWNSLVKLAVDVCRRHNFRLEYTGTPAGSLTRHNMFAATSCPGPYLQGRFEELVKVVNAQLDGEQPTPTPTPTPSTGRKVGDVVTINGVYTASNSTRKLAPARTTGTITRIISGALNPYLLDNGNLGWVNDSVITSGGSTPSPTPSKKSAEEVAREILYSPNYGGWGVNPERRQKLEAAGYNPTEVQGIINKLASGGSVPSPSPAPSSSIKKGDKVKVTNAVDYNGTKLSSSVLSNTYDVIEVKGDRVVIGKGSAVTAAMKSSNLRKV